MGNFPPPRRLSRRVKRPPYHWDGGGDEGENGGRGLTNVPTLRIVGGFILEPRVCSCSKEARIEGIFSYLQEQQCLLVVFVASCAVSNSFHQVAHLFRHAPGTCDVFRTCRSRRDAASSKQSEKKGINQL